MLDNVKPQTVRVHQFHPGERVQAPLGRKRTTLMFQTHLDLAGERSLDFSVSFRSNCRQHR